MEPSAEILDDLVRRILQVAQPLPIILFGSAARGEMGPNSDLDVLVVMPDGTNGKELWEQVYLNLFGLGVAKDLIVATVSEIQKHKDNLFMIYHDALTEGRELYHAAV
jgi:predicted nucleotidyltransferase